MASNFSVARAGGRLITARWHVLHNAAEAQEYRSALLDAVNSLKVKAVICADWSAAMLVAPDVAAALLLMLTGVSTKTERSGILLANEHATFNLQAERLVRDANFAGRRTFRDPKLLIDYIAPLLQPAEIAAAQQFLGLPSPKDA